MFIKVDDKNCRITEPSLEMILDLKPENEIETFLIPQLLLENIITKILKLNKVDYVTIYEKNGERLQKTLDKCEFSAKINYLINKKVIDKNEHAVLKEICDLRNCYVHNLIYKVKEVRVKKIIDYGGLSTFFCTIFIRTLIF